MALPVIASVRLGKDSVDDCKILNSAIAGEQRPSISLEVRCKQVPSSLQGGSYAVVWLGSDNNKGQKTEWSQGFRAIGKIESVSPVVRTGDTWTTLSISIGYVFENSISRLDVLRCAPQAYYWCAALPIIGLDDRANQTVRIFDDSKANSVIEAFFYCLNAVDNNIASNVSKIYTDLAKIFQYQPTNPDAAEASFNIHENTTPSDHTIGENVILYGVPGSGKSYKITHEFGCNISNSEKTVFHPDYTYGDFVGQILPVMSQDDNAVTYKFVPGPFSRILRRALWNPNQQHFLVIDEINRGNAPSIFGDIFQLLDRDEGTGRSEYVITNPSIARYAYSSHNNSGDTLDVPEDIIDANSIYIPANLTILATMNTADQNVFTLDTAFQRRWDMRYVENDFSTCAFANKTILDTSVTWSRFAEVINTQLTTASSSMMSSEDKRLGAYFISQSDFVGDSATTVLRFTDKVIKYLWDDAFRYSRAALFNGQYKTLDQVMQGFKKQHGDERFSIFENTIIDKLIDFDNKEDSSNNNSVNVSHSIDVG